MAWCYLFSTEAERQHRLIEHLIASLATWRETPGELLLELDANGVVTFCSQEIVKRFGYPAEAWVGQPLTKMISCTGEAGHVRGRTTRCEGTVKDATGTAVTVQCEIWRVGDNLPSGPAGVRLTII